MKGKPCIWKGLFDIYQISTPFGLIVRLVKVLKNKEKISGLSDNLNVTLQCSQSAKDALRPRDSFFFLSREKRAQILGD